MARLFEARPAGRWWRGSTSCVPGGRRGSPPRALELNATIPAMPAYADLAAFSWLRAAARARGRTPRAGERAGRGLRQPHGAAPGGAPGLLPAARRDRGPALHRAGGPARRRPDRRAAAAGRALPADGPPRRDRSPPRSATPIAGTCSTATSGPAGSIRRRRSRARCAIRAVRARQPGERAARGQGALRPPLRVRRGRGRWPSRAGARRARSGRPRRACPGRGASRRRSCREVIAGRVRYVVKRSWDYGGKSVHLGAELEQGAWARDGRGGRARRARWWVRGAGADLRRAPRPPPASRPRARSAASSTATSPPTRAGPVAPGRLGGPGGGVTGREHPRRGRTGTGGAGGCLRAVAVKPTSRTRTRTRARTRSPCSVKRVPRPVSRVRIGDGARDMGHEAGSTDHGERVRVRVRVTGTRFA